VLTFFVLYGKEVMLYLLVHRKLHS